MLEKLPEGVGRILESVRPGLEKVVANSAGVPGGCGLTVTSPAIVEHQPMALEFTADGAGKSPPIAWSGVPAEAVEVVILVEDADSPTPLPLVHLVAFGLPGKDGGLPAGALNGDGDTVCGVVTGKNSFLKAGWLPPDPPPGHGPHRYAVQVYALSEPSGLKAGAGKDELVKRIKATALSHGCMVGVYERGMS